MEPSDSDPDDIAESKRQDLRNRPKGPLDAALLDLPDPYTDQQMNIMELLGKNRAAARSRSKELKAQRRRQSIKISDKRKEKIKRILYTLSFLALANNNVYEGDGRNPRPNNDWLADRPDWAFPSDPIHEGLFRDSDIFLPGDQQEAVEEALAEAKRIIQTFKEEQRQQNKMAVKSIAMEYAKTQNRSISEKTKKSRNMPHSRFGKGRN